MSGRIQRSMATWLAVFAAICATRSNYLGAQPPDGANSHAWTMETAMAQLSLYPRDAYLQYVVMQLHERDGDSMDGDMLARLTQRGRPRRGNGNTRDVDLFSIFSGALAVQESLQMEAMTGSPPDGDHALTRDVSELTGPTVKSHPWTEMLAGRTPAISPLAQYVPEDYLFVQFRTVGNFLQAMQLADHWGAYVVSQTRQEARTLSATSRLKRQLAVETSDILQPIYDRVIEQIAITSSDLYFREGTDVTLLMRLKQPQLFRAQMDQFLDAAGKNELGATRSEGVLHGIPYVHVTSPERTVHVFSAYPRPDLHVRSNSRVGLERVLATIQGKTESGRPIARLGDSDEFAFIRTIMAEGADEEDGFIYMSDPFIRKLVGPQSKLTQRRRVLCYNHLRMIGHASLLHTTETGKQATSLDQLREARCLPESFGSGHWTCLDGGEYSLSSDGLSGICSHHGHANALVPCGEIPVSRISDLEAAEYTAFLDRYNEYWRTFFDPIAIRLGMTPKRYRLETVVLPLIDNSIYTNLAMGLGGTPEPLDAFPIPKRNILTLGLKLDKAELLRRAGISAQDSDSPPPTSIDSAESFRRRQIYQVIGVAAHNFHDTNGHFPPSPNPDGGAKSGLSWRVHLLPYLEQEELYEKFHLEEPWDSEHNRPLIAKIPPPFRPANSNLASEGKTTFHIPRGTELMLDNDIQGRPIRSILDGTSNTIMLVELDDAHAEIWTKPDTFQIDTSTPREAMRRTDAGTITALLADGSIVELPATISNGDMASLLTIAGGEPVIDLAAFRPRASSGRGRWPFDEEIAARVRVTDFLTRGIGEQISLNICDADPLVDFNVSRFLGMAVGSFSGRGGNVDLLDGEAMVALLAISLNVPVYLAIPVNDAAIVDRSLQGLDEILAALARGEIEGIGDFFEIEQDFYRFAGDEGGSVRSYAFRFGPLKWRFFWARIGNGLYLASKPFIIEDLLALEKEQREQGTVAQHDAGPAAHGLLRVRPTNWNLVLPQYRIGWAENQRVACLHNLGPLSSLSRALHAMPHDDPGDGGLEANLHALAHRVFGADFYCPSRGNYVIAPDGDTVTCTVHGSATAPRQPFAPGADTRLGALLNDLREVSCALTFLEDGLHAVVTIDRR